MKKLTTLMLLFIATLINAQDKTVVAWLDANAISIEDATPTTPPAAFAASVPQKFKDARIFGFGEATHHGKEFFDLKAKFFKYLVEKQGVTVFIFENSYYNGYLINQWLAGGEGDVRKLVSTYSFAIWRCEEVVALLQWMKNYNTNKPREKQIRFYGMDDQFGIGVSMQVREFTTKYKLNIQETLLAEADSCSNLYYAKRMPIRNWLEAKNERIKLLKESLRQETAHFTGADRAEADEAMHALDVLGQYVMFSVKSSVQARDNDMYNNVVWIMRHEGINSRAFIWAHNAHIDKKAMGNFNTHSLGVLLKQYFADGYYAVGFDFGKGSLYTPVNKGDSMSATLSILDTPFKKTYAETFAAATDDMFFIDIAAAIQSPVMNKFLSSAKAQLSMGNGGFEPKHPRLEKRKYTETYDGLIFVENISCPAYLEDSVPAWFLPR